MDQQNIELFKHENYSFRMMTQADKQQALKLLIDQFADQQPFSLAYWKRSPELNNIGRDEWTRFWNFLIDDCIKCRMSLVIVDLNANEIIGATAAKDLNIYPPNFQQEFMSNLNFFSSVISLEEEMIKRTKFQSEEFLKQVGKIMDVWGVALRKKHMGKRLLHKMLAGNQILAKRQGLEYSFVYATNFKTGIALMKQNYEKLDEIECRQFEYRGVKPFQMAEQINSKASIWIKKLI